MIPHLRHDIELRYFYNDHFYYRTGTPYDDIGTVEKVGLSFAYSATMCARAIDRFSKNLSVISKLKSGGYSSPNIDPSTPERIIPPHTLPDEAVKDKI